MARPRDRGHVAERIVHEAHGPLGRINVQAKGPAVDGGRDRTGADRVDPDAVLTELVRRGPGQLENGRLAGAVVVPGIAGGQARDARGVNDAAPPLWPHDAGRGPDAEKYSPDVDSDGSVERGHVDLVVGTRRAGVPGVV